MGRPPEHPGIARLHPRLARAARARRRRRARRPSSPRSPPARLGAERPLVVRDLGCGTGSLGRWLAPQLPGPQSWVLHDRDADLLARAEAGLPRTAADGTPVTARAEQGDLTPSTPRSSPARRS